MPARRSTIGDLRTIFLQFEDANWEDETDGVQEHGRRNAATMTVDGQQYPTSASGFAACRRSAWCRKRSNTRLTFRWICGQQTTIGGYKTLNLLNCTKTPRSFDRCCHEIAGNTWPRQGELRVAINGESWAYVNVEQFSKNSSGYSTTDGVLEGAGSPGA